MSAEWRETQRYAARIADTGTATTAAEPPALDELAEHPGEPHVFSTACLRCGEMGMVHLSLITPNERVDITDTRLAHEERQTSPVHGSDGHLHIWGRDARIEYCTQEGCDVWRARP